MSVTSGDSSLNEKYSEKHRKIYLAIFLMNLL